jgi:polyhydroxybutyrate depolymerase
MSMVRATFLLLALLVAAPAAPATVATGYPIVDLPEPAPASPRAGSVFIDLGRGPVEVFLPATYDPEVPAPLVVALHGYGASGNSVEGYLRFLDVIDEFGFLYAHPDGTEDGLGKRFWNATDACCNFFGSGVDDSQYLLDLVDAIAGQLNVDDRRIFFTGHSNGGFMSYRMACDHPDVVAAIASLAGATFDNPNDCAPSEPVHVLQIHGTADEVILYGGGGILGNSYPGAVESVEQWATFGGCDLVPEDGPAIDLDTSIPGDETSTLRYETGCASGGSGELWTIAGGVHSPSVTGTFAPLVMEFFLAHPKPASAGAGVDVARSPVFRVHPNPFSASTEISLSLVDPAVVGVEILDVGGRRVRTLLPRGALGAGTYRLVWHGAAERGRDVPDGIYFVRLMGAGPDAAVRKIVRGR